MCMDGYGSRIQPDTNRPPFKVNLMNTCNVYHGFIDPLHTMKIVFLTYPPGIGGGPGGRVLPGPEQAEHGGGLQVGLQVVHTR